LAAACDDLSISYPENASIKTLTDVMNAYLLEAHARDRRTILIIDEAQNLSIEVLEQLRLLTNLETHQRKLLQIILLGQPELLDVLAKPELRQLSQRITARFHLGALTREEVTAYIRHRLGVAGAKGNFFSKRAIDQIFKLSDGIPRIINLVCDRSMLGAYSEGEMQVTPSIVDKAAGEILGPRKASPMDWRRIAIAAIGCLTLVTGYLLFDLLSDNDSQPSAAAVLEAPSPKGIESSPPAVMVDAGNTYPASVSPALAEGQTLITPETAIRSSTNRSAEPVVEEIISDIPVNAVPAPSGPTIQTTDPGMSVAESIEPLITPLSSLIGHGNFQSALNDLLKLWEVDFTDPETATCELAETIGLFCYENIAGLNEMNDFNRPVIMNLNGRWFTLTGIGRDHATVLYGDETFDIRVSELLEYWNGNFTLLWRAPPGYQVPLTVGDRGPAVDWLVNRLAIINDANPPLSPGYIFDGTLESRVRQFQLSSGLTPDGIAGVKTWIKINDKDGVATPRLDKEAS
jgi:general secretion pathway protein A